MPSVGWKKHLVMIWIEILKKKPRFFGKSHLDN